ncbi:MAG: lipoyl(octanoyl) transferase LipB [Planctomycetota bacterium]
MPSDAQSISNQAAVIELGPTGYRAGMEIQREHAARREAGEIGDTLILLEHPPVYTVGTGGTDDHVLADQDELAARGVEVHRCDRGGEVTWHGPGQIVGYVIADLRPRGKDVGRFCRDLEEIMIRTLADHGIEGRRVDGDTGAWVGREKVGALGVHVRRWITTHGFALNVDCDLTMYERIIPCGIFDKGVTSMHAVSGDPVDIAAVRGSVRAHFEELFVG